MLYIILNYNILILPYSLLASPTFFIWMEQISIQNIVFGGDAYRGH